MTTRNRTPGSLPRPATKREIGGQPMAWLMADLRQSASLDGLVWVNDYDPRGRPASEISIIEIASSYSADAVFFEAGTDVRTETAQAFVYESDGPTDDVAFAELHQRLWSWGGVPIIYRRSPGRVDLFRCAHKPDFAENGKLVCRPFDTLRVGAKISAHQAWWDADRLRNGTLWDDPDVADQLLSVDGAAHRKLVLAVKRLHARLGAEEVLSESLRRRLLILSLLIAYLNQRGALPDGFFGSFLEGAASLPSVLADANALVLMLEELSGLFNGGVFTLSPQEVAELKAAKDLKHFSELVDARSEDSGQMTLWALYSFRDLPVEVISHIYELFVSDPTTAVYTPPALVRLILDETLDDVRIDRVIEGAEVILDPACGSGIFLVEAYKKIVLRWRFRNNWKQPDVETLRTLLERVHGVDSEEGAIELANFSMCIALCDALTADQIRSTPKLFPELLQSSLIHSCFFKAKDGKKLPTNVGVVVGNAPFKSGMETPGAQVALDRYIQEHGAFPDLQVAYLFLHEATEMLVPGGRIGMLQPHGLLYNQKAEFRRKYFKRWHVREILDFVSVRGLFTADTKVVAIVSEASKPPASSSTLHAVFRRSSRADANQRFDVDYYDLHWLSRDLITADSSPDLWRSNLFGGARTYAFVKRLRQMPTLQQHAKNSGWDFGEGFIEGARGLQRNADHLYGQPLLRSEGLGSDGYDETKLTTVPRKPIEGPRTAARFTAPMLLIREHSDLPHALVKEGYLTYKNKIVGFAAPDIAQLLPVQHWLDENLTGLRAYSALISLRMVTQRATTLSCKDIYDLPYNPESSELTFSKNEARVASDVVEHYLEYIRIGSASRLARANIKDEIENFTAVFTDQINAFYPKKPLRPAGVQTFGGVTCAAYTFGDGSVDWSNRHELPDILDNLLRQNRGQSLAMTRIARIYDGEFLFLVKPDRLRYWLGSTALRDADDTLDELRAQGF